MQSDKKYTIPDEHYYRCAFPRGRMLSKLEDDLTVFVQLILQTASQKKVDFESKFDQEYAKLHSLDEKTIKNRRTEMVSLYGLTVTTDDGYVEPSRMSLVLSESQDFYLFFKLFCLKFQFPNCINKSNSTIEQLNKSIRFKPAKFILELLSLGVKKHGWDFSVSSGEISSLVFNDLRVTTGKINPDVCMDVLTANRRNNIVYDGGSKSNQHGREFLDYMRLANLLVTAENGRDFKLNRDESEAIDYIVKDGRFFELPDAYTDSHDIRVATENAWEKWYGDVDDKDITALKTKPQTLPELAKDSISVEQTKSKEASPTQTTMKDIGDVGEMIVLKYEKEKIGEIRPDKVHLVQRVSNDTVLGFDIQSFEFEDTDRKKFIEVKTTNRTYPPGIDILTSFYMSSNEWQTAKNYLQSYYIYRVFLLHNETKIFVVKNPTEKEKEGLLILEPTNYRVILKQGCGGYISD